MIAAAKHTAIITFSRKDVLESMKTDSGLEVISGGTVSDRDLYFTPQKCKILDIDHPFFKNGDTIYVDHIVWNAGTGLDKRGNSRFIEGDENDRTYFCFHAEIFAKIEDGKICPCPEFVFMDKKDPPIKSEFLHVIEREPKVIWGIVKASHPDSEIKESDVVLVPTVAFFNNSRVEGKWIYIVPSDKVMGVLQ